MGDQHLRYGLHVGVDAFGNPLTPHMVAAASPGPIRAEPIPLTAPAAQWQEPVQEPPPQPAAPVVNVIQPSHTSRRDTFTGQIFASLIVHSGANASEQNLQRMAQLAVRASDLLLAELDKSK